MKAVTVTIPEVLDAQAADEARRLGISKSELFRRGLHAVIAPKSEAEHGSNDGGGGPWIDLAGFGPAEISVAPGEIDDVLYPREHR